MTLTTGYSARNATGALDLVLQLHWVRPSSLNPRKHFDQAKLEELAESIRQHGLLEPLVVRETRDASPAFPMATFEIVAGERRYRACLLAGLTEVPVRNLGAIDDRTALELALIENLQRVDLDPIEEAEGYRQLNRVVGKTQVEIATAVNRSQPAIANAMRLLDLPEEVQELIRDGEISVSHGIALAKWKEWPKVLGHVVEKIGAERLTAKQVESFDISEWSLQHRGIVRRVNDWDTKFDQSVCTSCAFGAYRAMHGITICLKPEHYDELQAAAKEVEASRLRESLAQQGHETSMIPLLRELDHEAIVNLQWDVRQNRLPPGCSESCACRGLALTNDGETVPICRDRPTHAAYVKRHADEVQQARKDRYRANLSKLACEVDGATAALALRELVVLVESIVMNAQAEQVGRAIKRLALPIEAKTLRDQNNKRKVWRTLARLTPTQLLRLGVEVKLAGDLEWDLHGYSVGGDLAKWYLRDVAEASDDEAPAETDADEVAATA